MSLAGTVSLVGGNLALDFANTASGLGSPTPFERLHAPADLLDWAHHAGVVDGDGQGRMAEAFAADSDGAARALRHALALRGSIFAIGTAIAHGTEPARGDLDRVKDAAQKAMASAALSLSDGRYRFDFGGAAPEAALTGPIALAALDLLANADFSRVKQCPGHGPGNDCQWLFLDVSKNNSRRWCDMATCGNRTKGKRHRARQAAGTPAPSSESS